MASFVEAVLKRKVATICDHVGYNAITKESSNVLVDLYRRTIVHLARHCKEAANNNRRVEPTLIDLIQAYDFVGISIPELQEHAENVKIAFDVKLESQEDVKPSNRIQRNLFVDDLLDAEKNIGQTEDNYDVGENKAIDDASAEEDDKNMTPLLRDIYQEISTNFPSPSKPIKAEKVRIKREEKPVIPKLKITPLDPSIAEPPSFLPILGGTVDVASCAGGSRPSPPPSSEKPKRGRQKGTKLKAKAQLKASSSSVKASNKVVAKAKCKGAKTKLKTIKTKLKTKGRGRQVKAAKQEPTKASSPDLPVRTPTPTPTPPPVVSTFTPPPPPVLPTTPAPPEQIELKTEDPEPYPIENALLEAPTFSDQKQSKQKKKKKRSSNQFAIVTETVTAAAPAEEEEWLCPNCNGPDNGDLMVGCDKCELWYHLRCTNLKKPPKDDENWLCNRCIGPSKKMPTPTATPAATPALTPAPAPAPSTPIPNLSATSSTVGSTSKSQSSKGRKRPPPELPVKLARTPELKTPKHTPTPPPKPSTNELADEPPQERPPVVGMSQDDLCPECQLPDDGTLMIQCDDPFCARWFHGKCVSVLEEPKDDESWFCKVCVDKQQSAFKRRRRAI